MSNFGLRCGATVAWRALILLFVFNVLANDVITSTSKVATAQEREPIRRGDEEGRNIEFSIESEMTAPRLRQFREVAIFESIRTLERFRDSEASDTDNLRASEAARILGDLRTDEPLAIGVLLQNLTLHARLYPATHWLNGYVAAESLVKIGGPKVASAVLEYLKEPRDRLEVLLCAHVLFHNDDLPITLERIRLAEQRLRSEAEQEVAQDETGAFQRNLALVKEWLNDPRFGKDRKYLP